MLIALKTGVFKTISEVPLPISLHDLEIVSAEIVTATNKKILLCLCYHLQSDANCAILFKAFLDFTCDIFENIVIWGNFNFAKIPWDVPYCALCTKEMLFVDALNDPLFNTTKS